MATIKAQAIAKSTMSADEQRWRTEDDLRTIARAKEIQRDPVRMKAVRALAQQQLKDAQATANHLTKGETK